MRKNLGSKRREITEEACDEITRIYAEMLNGEEEEYSRVFQTTDFAYREIRVERPLRLSFEMTDGAKKALEIAKAFTKLPEEKREQILSCLSTFMPTGKIWLDRKEFLASLNEAIKKVGIKLSTPIKQAILTAFKKRNKQAEICRNAKGNTEPDKGLRDHELVPFDENWQDYFEREVKPFVPDAWVDETYIDIKDAGVGRVGYEINFNRYFYKYSPPRSITEINAELKTLEAEIANLLEAE